MSRDETTPISLNSPPEALATVKRIQQFIARFVVGHERTVERLLIALLTGGHVLVEGNPGLGKTLLARAFAKSMDLLVNRVQFTVDMLPSDVVGSEVLRKDHFEVELGPVFTNILIADEINRAPPKTQSALLEAMQERQVTLGKKSFPLPHPLFLVIATQNSVEMGGTYELPEAQLDRFLLYVRLRYPSELDEEDIVRRELARSAFESLAQCPPVVTDPGVNLPLLRKLVEKTQIDDGVINFCVRLAQKTRDSEHLLLGCSPRASIALAEAARARAFLNGADRVGIADVLDVANDVLLHRMRLTITAQVDGMTKEAVLGQILTNHF